MKLKAMIDWCMVNWTLIVAAGGALYAAADAVIRLVVPTAKANDWARKGGLIKSKLAAVYLAVEPLFTWSRKGKK